MITLILVEDNPKLLNALHTGLEATGAVQVIHACQSGEEALEFGLVDKMGNLEDAIELAGRMGGIEGKISTVYPPEEKISLVRHLMDASVRELSRALKNATTLQAQYRME